MKVVFISKKKIKAMAVMVMGLMLVVLAVVLWPDGSLSVAGRKKDLPIYYVGTQEKKVAITLDAAWGNDETQQILDVLDQYQAKATFFLVGYWVDAYPDQVKLIDQNGHVIGNHSSTHPHMTKLGRDQVLTELADTSNKITALTGKPVNLFRPPYGDWNENLVRISEEAGYSVIQWNIDSLDWKGTTGDEMLARTKEKLEPGSILLFHNNSDHIIDGLKKVLEELSSQGYQFVTVDQLIYKDNYTIDHDGKQISNATVATAKPAA